MATAKRFLREPAVLARYGFSHATLWREIKAGRFPAPCRIAAKAIGWPEAELDTHDETLERVGPANEAA
jgi:prophage regulatory protein